MTGTARDSIPVRAAKLHECLQNEYRCQLVDDFGLATSAHVGLAEQSVGLHGGEALVKQVDRQLEPRPKFRGEGFDFVRLNTMLAAHAEWQPHHDLPDSVLLDGAAQMIKIVLLVGAVQRGQALGRQAKFVGYGQPDAARAAGIK